MWVILVVRDWAGGGCGGSLCEFLSEERRKEEGELTKMERRILAGFCLVAGSLIPETHVGSSLLLFLLLSSLPSCLADLPFLSRSPPSPLPHSLSTPTTGTRNPPSSRPLSLLFHRKGLQIPLRRPLCLGAAERQHLFHQTFHPTVEGKYRGAVCGLCGGDLWYPIVRFFPFPLPLPSSCAESSPAFADLLPSLASPPLPRGPSLMLVLVLRARSLMFAAYPVVFVQQRGWSPGQAGLPFIAVGVGMLLGMGGTVLDSILYGAKLARAGGTLRPEERLRGACIGGVVSIARLEGWCGEGKEEANAAGVCVKQLLPVSLAWFAASADPGVHWISATLAGELFGCSMLLSTFFYSFFSFSCLVRS